RTHARCMSATGPTVWSLLEPELCAPIGGDGCPPTPNASGDCAPNGLLCPYATGAECVCSVCGMGPCSMKPAWACSPAPNDACPASAPNTGQACSPDGKSCQYGLCGAGTAMLRVCQSGVWVDMMIACPH